MEVIDLTGQPDEDENQQQQQQQQQQQEEDQQHQYHYQHRPAATYEALSAHNQPHGLHRPIPGPSSGVVVPTPTTSGRLIDLTDDNDDIEFLSERRLHLPPRPFERGNDSISPQRAALLQEVQGARARQGLFSRDVQPGPSHIRIHDEPPLATRRDIVYDFVPNPNPNGAALGPAGEAAARRWQRSGARSHRSASVPDDARGPAQQNASTSNSTARVRADPNQAAPARLHGLGQVPPPPPPQAADTRGGRAARRNAAAAGNGAGGGGVGFRGILNDPREYGIPGLGGFPGVERFGRVMADMGAMLLAPWGFAEAAGAREAARRAAAYARAQAPPQYYNPGSVVPASIENARRGLKYRIAQSHPKFSKKLAKPFTRVIVPPPEYDPDQEEQDESSTAASSSRLKNKGKGRADPTNLDQKAGAVLSSLGLPMHHSRLAAASATEGPTSLHPVQSGSTAVAPPSSTSSNSDKDPGDSDHLQTDPASSSTTSATSLEADPDADTRKTPPSNSSSPSIVPVVPTIKRNDDHPLELPSISVASLTKAPSRTRKVMCPVCTSCASPLYLNQSSSGRPYLLRCGHVVCFKCLNAAKSRCTTWSERKTEEGEWAGAPLEEFEEIVPASSRAGAAAHGRGRAVQGRASKGIKRARKYSGADEEEEEQQGGNKRRRRNVRGTRRSLRQTATATTNGARIGFGDEEEDEEDELDENYVPSPSPSDIPVPPIGHGSESEAESSKDDEMNDGPRQPKSSRAPRAGQGEAKISRNEDQTERVDTQLGQEEEEGGDSKRRTAKTGGRKGKDASQSQFSPSWLSCPVIGCPGKGTDLTADLGTRTGAWEMFV